ncbi:hypothetical protein MKFW12EY_20950 [Methylomonas koyamae]|nr:hypothetical protein MKFW12EY_20950 [Methylomonas koyamae]
MDVLCQLMSVSRSTDYQWLKRGPTAGEKDDAALSETIQSTFVKSRSPYGTRRLKPALSAQNRTVSRRRIG